MWIFSYKCDRNFAGILSEDVPGAGRLCVFHFFPVSPSGAWRPPHHNSQASPKVAMQPTRLAHYESIIINRSIEQCDFWRPSSGTWNTNHELWIQWHTLCAVTCRNTYECESFRLCSMAFWRILQNFWPIVFYLLCFWHSQKSAPRSQGYRLSWNLSLRIQQEHLWNIADEITAFYTSTWKLITERQLSLHRAMRPTALEIKTRVFCPQRNKAEMHRLVSHMSLQNGKANRIHHFEKKPSIKSGMTESVISPLKHTQTIKLQIAHRNLFLSLLG